MITITLDQLQKLKSLLSDSLRIEMQISTDRSDSTDLKQVIDFGNKIQKAVDILGIPVSSLEVLHNHDDSDHEVISKYVDFQYQSIVSGNECIVDGDTCILDHLDIEKYVGVVKKGTEMITVSLCKIKPALLFKVS